MAEFVDWYNHQHRHCRIGLHTPADAHYGLAAGKADERAQAMAAARAAHPERFTTGHTPQILALPEAAWINPPDQHDDHTAYEPAA